jgi:hypothetical protein
MIYFQIELNIPNSNFSLVTDKNPKDKNIFRAVKLFALHSVGKKITKGAYISMTKSDDPTLGK